MNILLNNLTVEQSERLGLAFPAGDFTSYEALADAGFGNVRLGVSWDRIQPGDGTWRFDGLDAKITMLYAHGIDPLLTFYSDADWATRPSDDAALNKTPERMDEWGTFIEKTVSRYADMVDTYQVANEFAGLNNASGGWGGTEVELVEYVDTSWDAVKAADPDSTFVMGGVASFVSDIALVNLGNAEFEPHQPHSATTETRFTVKDVRSAEMSALVQSRLLYALQNAQYDQADIHLYGDRSLDSQRVAMMQDLTGRSIISSESGAPTFDGTNVFTQTDYFTSAVVAGLGAMASGVETVYWFQDFEGDPSYYNQHVPLRDADGSPKPSFWAHKLMAAYLIEDSAVTSPANGVFHIQSAQEGDTVIGFAADVEAAVPMMSFSIRDIWVLKKPETGLLHRLEPGEAWSPDDFVIADTGCLARLATETPVDPEGILTGSSAISFIDTVGQRTKIDMIRDGETVDEFWYTGEMSLPTATIDRLGLSMSAKGPGDSAIGLGHGVLGVTSAGESRNDVVQINDGEFLFLDIEQPRQLGERSVLVIEAQAESVDDGETALFEAYLKGTRVAVEEAMLTSRSMIFDPGLDFDRVGIGARSESGFSLQLLEVDWYAVSLV